MYINDKLTKIYKKESAFNEDDRAFVSFDFKKSYLENEDWHIMERAVRGVFKMLYEGGQLTLKPKDVVVGYRKVEDNEDKFEVYVNFERKMKLIEKFLGKAWLGRKSFEKDGQGYCKFYVPFWSWPLEILHRLITGNNKATMHIK